MSMTLKPRRSRCDRIEIAGLIHGVQNLRYRVRLWHDGALRALGHDEMVAVHLSSRNGPGGPCSMQVAAQGRRPGHVLVRLDGDVAWPPPCSACSPRSCRNKRY